MAITFQVDIDISQLKGLENETRRAQDRAMDKSLDWLTERARVYPPVRPSSTYVRTGDHKRGVIRLKRSFTSGEVKWTDRYSRGGREYAHWVRDSQRQAAVHRGRWPTDRDIAKEATQKIKGFYEGEFNKLK